jgi:hypothetical protein
MRILVGGGMALNREEEDKPIWWNGLSLKLNPATLLCWHPSDAVIKKLHIFLALY